MRKRTANVPPRKKGEPAAKTGKTEPAAETEPARPKSLPIVFAGPPWMLLYSEKLYNLTLSELRKLAKWWVGPSASKMVKEPLLAAVRDAIKDDDAAARVFQTLTPLQRAVAAVYRRYGGLVDGRLIRIDLMARGLLEIETIESYGHTREYWKVNPLESLADRWVLLHPRARSDWSYSYYRRDISEPFENYVLHPGIAKRVEPAGPVRWSIPASPEIPRVITRRSPSEVAIELSRVFAFFAARGSVKIRLDGVLAVPSVKALLKAVPLETEKDFPLPDRHGLAFEILKLAGAIRLEENEARADAAAAGRLFAMPDAAQAHLWARGWLMSESWNDGFGLPATSNDGGRISGGVQSERSVLAWALGGLARGNQGDQWFELNPFLAGLYELTHPMRCSLPYFGQSPVWRPDLSALWKIVPSEKDGRARNAWFDQSGPFFANALMITLVALGLVERGTTAAKPGAEATLLFRLTELGRAVFGAPEVPMPEMLASASTTTTTELAPRRFLVIQPNFDVVAYLDQADVSSAAFLGQIAEHDHARSGPVQTFRISQKSVYNALESGLTYDRIVDFLRTRGQPDLPPNVVRTITDWSGKREALTLRSGGTLIGFRSTAERDSYVTKHSSKATPLGDRFATLAAHAATTPKVLDVPKAVVLDHRTSGPAYYTLDEYGRLAVKTPLDVVRAARLRRFAETDSNSSGEWRISGDSIRRAVTGGLTGARIRRWLEDSLLASPPPILLEAIDAWAGRKSNVVLGEMVLLHVPDEDQYDAIVESDRCQPFLLGSPGDLWLAIKRDRQKEFAALLNELGFNVLGMETVGEIKSRDSDDRLDW